MADEEVNQTEFRLCQYLDGQLGRKERRQFEQQLQADPALREELELYASLEGMLGGLALGEPEGMDVNYDQQRAQIVAAAEKRALLAPARHAPFFLRPTFAVLAAAAVVLLLVAGSFLLSPATVGPTKPPAAAVAVTVQLLSAEPSRQGQGTVSVQFEPLGQEEMPPESQATALPATPAGTVVVSVGPAPAPASESASSDTEFVY
jgi:anti-sigma factor RsiW